jgi:DNA-binding NarL/FixJ family response regulator
MAPARVFIVDGSEPFRRLIQAILQSSRFEIIGQACNGLEAVRKAAELRPDLILLDIGLPELNGIEAAKQIGEVATRSKILFVSQDTSIGYVEAALSIGALGYVHKSRIQTDLLPAIDSVRRVIGEELEVRDLTDKGNAQAPHRRAPYRFEFDPTNSILQGRFEGFVSAQEVRNYYQTAVEHVARLSPRGYIIDVSAVTSTTVSTGTLLALAKLPPVLPDPQRPRFIVAPHPAAFWLMRMYELAAEVTRPNLHVVRKHAEAWAILGVREPRFEPLPVM